jgi:hypothetical protein
MQRLSSMLKRNLIAIITVALIISTLLLVFLAYYNSAFYYDAELAMVVRVLDPLYAMLAMLTGISTVAFIVCWVIIVVFFGRTLDKFYTNSKVYKISAKNFLNERWYIELFNGLRPEPEPIGKAVLRKQKVEIDSKLAKLRAKATSSTAPTTSMQADGGNLSADQVEADNIQLQAEIAKYESVITRIDACLENKMTICSIESRDHNYVWSHRVIQVEENGVLKEKMHGVLEKEIGWKVYLAVPGVNLEACTGTDELPINIGFKQKLLDTYQFAASIDLPPHPEIIEDPDSDSAVIIEQPLLGVRDTPHGGAYYDWDEPGGILVSKVLDIPLSTSYKSEIELKDTKIAQLERKILSMQHEREMDGVLEEGARPVEPISMVQPMREGLQPQPQPQAPPNNSHSWGRTALIASACVALLGIGGVGIVTALAALL